MIPSLLNFFLPRCTAVLFLGVSAPYHDASAICLFCFSLDRVQGLDLQLCKYGFNARFIEARHLQKALMRSHGSSAEWALQRAEQNYRTQHSGKLQGWDLHKIINTHFIFVVGMVNRCFKKTSIAFVIETKNFTEKTHFLLYRRTIIAEKKLGLSNISALKSQTCFDTYDPF